MDSPPHSTVINKPRTLPACFASTRTTNGRVLKATEDVHSNTPIQGERCDVNDKPGTLPDCSSIRESDPVNDDEHIPSTSNAQSEEEIPIEECDTDVDESPFEEKPSASVNGGEVSSTETCPSSTVSSSVVDTPTVSNAETRSACRYGASCYRRNAQHKEEFSHPGDEDYDNGEARCSSSTDVNANKPPCWYGPRCYRKNKEHLENFSHSFTTSGRPRRLTTLTVEIRCDSDESEGLEDFYTDSDEYEASFIDDEDSSDDDTESEVEVASEMSADSCPSEDEANKKRKKKVSKKNPKKKKN